MAGIAALLIGTKRVGGGRNPRLVQDQIQNTSRDLGVPGFDTRYGWGLVDAAGALR